MNPNEAQAAAWLPPLPTAGPAPANFIDPSATIGEGTKVWHFAVIQRNVTIGADCSIGSHVEISAGGTIGDRVRIGKGTITAPGMTIGNDVFIGPNVTFCDDKHPIAGNSGYTAQPPTVQLGASIGAGAVIMPGVTIGTNATIGAGAIVLGDVRAYDVMVTKAVTITRYA